MRRPENASANALSFDLEHWHSATLLRSEIDDPTDRIEESVEIVLDLLERHGARATFFTVGEVAAEYPDLVAEIRDRGHEIGSHGHTHTPLFELTPDEFEDELSRSATAIRRAVGRDPVGFRAPNFSITRDTDWAFSVLRESQYAYDSSVFPVKTPMYGVGDAPMEPYAVSKDDPFVASPDWPDDALLEFPLSAADAGVRLPFAGGFYARVTPVGLLRRAIARRNARGVPANLYFHPWEFNPDVPRPDVPIHKRFVSFYGIERMGAKLESLLEAFEFDAVGRVLERRRARSVVADADR